ncbi:MAG: metal-dependent hydrolase [Candidatus Paceibacterota bacterium]
MKALLALLADIANGLFAVVFAGLLTGTEVVWWHFLVGIPLAMCPDLDALPELLRRGKVGASGEHAHDHREALHYPVLFVLAGVAFAYFVPYWGWMFLAATILHFVNDFYGTGWGIPVLWPLTNRRYKLLGRRVNRLRTILEANGDWDSIPEEERTLRLVVSWSHDELRDYIRKWGLDEWIGPYYLRLNWISGIEYVLFLLSLIAAYITLVY